jgi:hypothetical protein
MSHCLRSGWHGGMLLMIAHRKGLERFLRFVMWVHCG